MREDPTRDDNPVRRVRKALGMTQTELSLIAGTNTVSVYDLERGGPARITPAVMEALESLGIDAERLDVDYQAWRRLAGVRLLQQVQARQGNGDSISKSLVQGARHL